MHQQTKDVQNPECWVQFQFYLHNVMHMAKSKDMYIWNYNKLKATEECEEINYAAIYLENLQKRAAIMVEKGGQTTAHAHLRDLVAIAVEDREARRPKQKKQKQRVKITLERRLLQKRKEAPEVLATNKTLEREGKHPWHLPMPQKRTPLMLCRASGKTQIKDVYPRQLKGCRACTTASESPGQPQEYLISDLSVTCTRARKERREAGKKRGRNVKKPQW